MIAAIRAFSAEPLPRWLLSDIQREVISNRCLAAYPTRVDEAFIKPDGKANQNEALSWH